MARVLIASPPVAQRIQHHDVGFMPFLGMGYLAGTMRSRGHDVRIADSRLGRIDLPGLLDHAREFSPDVIGFSAMTHEVPQAYRAAHELKRLLPESRIALGGPHATALPQQTLEECESLDLVCRGEGESTFAEAVEVWSGQGEIQGCAGAVWRDRAGAIHAGEPRPWSRELDSLPFPAWDLFPNSDIYPIMTARGCHHRCNFCCRAIGGVVRKRSTENVIAELDWVARSFRPRLVRFEDETLAWDLDHIHAILDGILARGLHRTMQFSGQTRVDCADAELFRKLKAANFELIEMGVESGNPAILRASGKHIDVERVRGSFSLAREAGLRTWAKFIIGHPNETAQTIRDSIALAVDLNPTLVSFAIMVPYPGTAVWELARRGEGGYRLISPEWGSFDKFLGNALELEELPRATLERWQVRGYATVYLKNRRYLEFARLVLTHRKTAQALVKKMVGSVVRRASGTAGGRPGNGTPPARQSGPGVTTAVASERPLRVLHIITRMIVGGAQEHVLLSCALIDRERFPSGILAGPETGAEGDLWSEARSLGVPVRVEPSLVRDLHPWKDALATLRIARLLRREHYDVVVVHTSKAGIVGRLAARLARVPVVIHTAHGWAFTHDSRPLVVWFYAWLEAVFARLADAIVVVSEKVLDEGLAFRVGRRDQYHVIRSGIQIENYRDVAAAGEEVRAQVGIPDEAFVFGTVGRLVAAKAPLDLLAAFAPVAHECPRAHLVFVGDGPQRAEVEARVRALGLGDRVHLLGLRRDVPELLRAFDVFVLASRWEGLPRVFPEAMAAGLPIVATRVAGAPEAVVSGDNGWLVEPGDLAEFTGRLLELARSPESARRMGQRGGERVEEFSARRMVTQQEALYARLCAAATRGRPDRQAAHGAR